MKKTITSRGVRLDLTDSVNRERVFRIVNDVEAPTYHSYLLLKPARTLNLKVLIDWSAGAQYVSRFDLKKFRHLISTDPIVSLSPWAKSYLRLSHECLHRVFLNQDLSGDDNCVIGYWIATTKSGKKYQVHFNQKGHVSAFVSHVVVKEATTSDVSEPETKPQVELAAPPVEMKKKRGRPCKSVFMKPTTLTRDPNVSVVKRGRPRKVHA